jgi:large repetitive protein
MLMAGAASSLQSPTCGGGGPEDVYELRIQTPKVVVATTDNAATTADTVLYLRSADCANNSSEMACNDDDAMAMTAGTSTLTQSISTPGTYYLVVDAHDSGSGGAYDLSVKFLTGEGEVCSGPDDCGPGLVCRIPLGGTQKVCSKHVCSDGVDDDMPPDGKLDYPDDPGCTSPDDDDETDTCPGAGCPECADGMDNDSDGHIDYPDDTTCTSASSASESCVSTDGVVQIVGPQTMGDTTNAHGDVDPTCGSSSGTANDLTYRLDIPAVSTLNLNLTASFDTVSALYNSTCGGTAIACSDPLNMTVTNLAAGTYYFVVDGYFNDAFDTGPFTINLSGTIANGMPCDNPLVTAGAITCNTGYACKGSGTKTCQPALCSDGMDNDGDGKVDYPFDPGCSDPADDTEADPATPPVCHDGMDNDTDGATDFPADFGCAAASGASEVFCTGEADPASAITTKTTTGTTAGKSNDETPSCSSFSTASDVGYGLMLPVPVASLQIDTIGSSYDTVLMFRDASCAMETGCDDDGGGSLTSKLTLTNVAPGGYAIIVDGYSTSNGAFTLNVHGTVAVGTPCDATSIPGGNAALFAGGANAVLSCPASCSAATHRCL